MNRLAYLDSIRGIAAFLVVFHHIIVYFNEKNLFVPVYFNHLFEHLEIGRLGVILFFLTSGFVIPWSLNPDNPYAARDFALKRFFRLYPTYWFSILFAIVCGGLGVGISINSTTQVIINMTMVQRFLGIESINLAYWTLHVELIFYFICAALFYFGLFDIKKYATKLTILFLMIALTASAMRYFYGIRLPIVWPLGLASMFLGALIREYILNNKNTPLSQLLYPLLTFFLALIVCHKLYFQDGWLKWYLSYAFAYVAFILLCTLVKLQNPITVYLGRISYSLYLLHSAIIGVFYIWFGNTVSNQSGFFISIGVITVFSIIISGLTYELIERPSIGAGRALLSKIYNRVS